MVDGVEVAGAVGVVDGVLDDVSGGGYGGECGLAVGPLLEALLEPPAAVGVGEEGGLLGLDVVPGRELVAGVVAEAIGAQPPVGLLLDPGGTPPAVAGTLAPGVGGLVGVGFDAVLIVAGVPGEGGEALVGVVAPTGGDVVEASLEGAPGLVPGPAASEISVYVERLELAGVVVGELGCDGLVDGGDGDLGEPSGLVVDALADELLVADVGGGAVVCVPPEGDGAVGAADAGGASAVVVVVGVLRDVLEGGVVVLGIAEAAVAVALGAVVGAPDGLGDAAGGIDDSQGPVGLVVVEAGGRVGAVSEGREAVGLVSLDLDGLGADV